MSSPMRIAFLGDVVGQPGKRAAVAAAKALQAA
jgi:calcineurin-like phosphoesterase